MLRDLDLATARETYKRLRPDEHPKNYVFSDCKCGRCWSGFGRSYGPDDDWLDKVDVIGPNGADRKELDPWHGVEPRIIDMTHLCRCGHRKAPEPKWDASRTDFWNNPKLWDGIDPTKQMCWQRRPDEHLHSDGGDGGGTELNQRHPPSLRRNKRAEGVSTKPRSRKAPKLASSRKVASSRSRSSERTGA